MGIAMRSESKGHSGSCLGLTRSKICFRKPNNPVVGGPDEGVCCLEYVVSCDKTRNLGAAGSGVKD